MSENFIEELRWRGMIHDMMPGTEKLLSKPTVGYIGFDPTADSLHIGSLVPIMVLAHFQRHGHHPIVLLGGATGMVGDPSGKSQERNLLSEEQLQHNLAGIRKHFDRFLSFHDATNPARFVSNYDWFKEINFLDFIRDTGKHITVNYLMAKDSVKKRLSDSGMSFTEFSYQLVQGYDFYHLHQQFDCQLQMGGSDQWGNITTGTELIRRKSGGEAFALTTPLVTKADGSKFGKSEGGNIWLDPKRTSPYTFYQYWINSADEDASNYIRIFTLKSREEVEGIEQEHGQAPHLRLLQQAIAEELTERVHGPEALAMAKKASTILFGSQVTEELRSIDEQTLLSVFAGVPQVSIARSQFDQVMDYSELLADTTEGTIFRSRGEMRKLAQGGGLRINKEKVTDPAFKPAAEQLLQGKYVLVEKGKKNKFLLLVHD